MVFYKKFFKIILFVGIATVIASYVGFFTLNLSILKEIADIYGP